MNFADLEATWRSPQNRPSAVDVETMKTTFTAELRRRHRGTVGLLSLVLVPLVINSFLVVRHLVAPAPGHTPVDLGREWGLIPFFLLPWVGWLALVVLYRRHRNRHVHYDRSIRTRVQALLDENRSERRRHRIISALLVASAVVLLLVAQQLQAVGKAGNEILLPVLVIYPLYVAGIVAWAVVHERRKLQPRAEALAQMLRDYESGSGS